MFGVPQLIRIISRLIDTVTVLIKALMQNSKINVALAHRIEKLDFSINTLQLSVDELIDLIRVPIVPVGDITFTPISERDNKMIFRVGLPQLPADATQKDRDEIVRGELRLVYDGVAQPAIETALDQQTVDNVEIAEGVAVEGMFGYVDNAGNFSAMPVLLTPFTVADTIPPLNPVGEISMTVTGE